MRSRKPQLEWITEILAEMQLFSGRVVDVPSIVISGKSDWGVYQRRGNFERMQQATCTCMLGCHLIDGAGHWVQQEQPERVAKLLLEFFAEGSDGLSAKAKSITAR